MTHDFAEYARKENTQNSVADLFIDELNTLDLNLRKIMKNTISLKSLKKSFECICYGSKHSKI